ncbi:MAG TPA: sigma-E factor regulatory protein RseB domain-containing protein [Candidatus Baltobacteraceae bacterium]|nr:sigma-E factor regulatory protein RseB domain-containing protein [Candidatus Baltobacteraceae bacterium]
MQIRKRGALLAAVLSAVLCAPFAPALAQSGGDGTALLRDAVSAYSKYSYVGQVQNTDYGVQRADAVLFRLEHRAPDMTRRWYLAPESLYGDSIISRGDTSYDIDPHSHRIIVTHDDALDDQIAMDDNFGLLLHNYRAVIGPDDNIAGRRAISVLLVNRYTGETVMRISLDAQTKLVLQKERYSASGSVAHQMRFEQIRFTGAIPTELFTIPASGYARTEGPGHGTPSNDLSAVVRTAGFPAVGPKYLPDGFLPVAGDVMDIKSVRTLHILYSDGLRTISLFENARGAAVDMSKFTVHKTKVRSGEAQYVEDGPTTLLTWANGSRHFALVGELSQAELVRIASSVKS